MLFQTGGANLFFGGGCRLELVSCPAHFTCIYGVFCSESLKQKHENTTYLTNFGHCRGNNNNNNNDRASGRHSGQQQQPFGYRRCVKPYNKIKEKDNFRKKNIRDASALQGRSS